jgi:hypothetical protein
MTYGGNQLRRYAVVTDKKCDVCGEDKAVAFQCINCTEIVCIDCDCLCTRPKGDGS